MSIRDITPSQKSVLAKVPRFVPTPTSVNWLDLRKDFDKFVNQWRYEFKKQRTQHQKQRSSANTDLQSLRHQISNKDENNNLPPPPIKSNKFTPLYRSKETDNKSLEMFTEKIEKHLLLLFNIKKVRHKLSKDEKAGLKGIRNWDKTVARVQDQGSRFLALDYEDYVKKSEYQINRSSFQRLEYDHTKSFEVEVNTWVEKWS